MASIVDYLKGQGKDSSYSARQRLAQQYGISNYSGTASQNSLLLDKIQSQNSPQPSYSEPSYQQPQQQVQTQKPTQQSSTIKLLSPYGDLIEISKDQEQMALNSGYRYPGQEPTRQLETPVQQPIQTQPTPLPQSAEKVLDVLQDHLTKTPVNPDVAITPEMIAKFYDQAKTELEPYYGQLFKQAQDDLTVGFKQISEDLATNERNLESSYGKNLENIQEDAASRGLTFSSIRDTNEKSLAEQTQAAIEAGRREAERRAREIGTQGERQLGSSNLPNLPGINEAPTPILNKPGQYSFAKSTGVRDLFKPIGSTSGKLEQDKLAALESRKLELTNEERKLRSLNTI